MATVQIPDEQRSISDTKELSSFLDSQGIKYEHWDVDSRVGDEATDEEILAAYAPEIERLKAEGGFVTADVINVSPDTPNLDMLIEKFNKEHTHDEDEVRFVVEGNGMFHIHPPEGTVFAIEVERGDLINVPRGTKHWFNFCDDRTIRCIRLFQEKSGWTPHYIDDGVHEDFAPLCMGPAYFPVKSTASNIEPVVKP